jgi:hypothetical protein
MTLRQGPDARIRGRPNGGDSKRHVVRQRERSGVSRSSLTIVLPSDVIEDEDSNRFYVDLPRLDAKSDNLAQQSIFSDHANRLR